MYEGTVKLICMGTYNADRRNDSPAITYFFSTGEISCSLYPCKTSTMVDTQDVGGKISDLIAPDQKPKTKAMIKLIMSFSCF